MSQGDADPQADQIGLQLLLGGGLADAMAAVEGTLGSVQRAAEQAFAGMSAVQAAGGAVSALPPMRTEATAQVAGTTVPDPVTPGAPMSDVAGMSARASSAPAPQTSVVPASPAAPSAPMSVMPTAAAAAPPAAASPAAPVTYATFAPVVTAPASTPEWPVDSSEGQPTQSAQSGWPQPPAMRAPHYGTTQAAPAASSDGAMASRPMAPASAPAAASGPTGGDVFLDGTRMGTWVADHLAREVNRPQAGGTGFDPRLTPAWPGTLQGG